ncbi:hypothetical protein COV82_06475 [Candidatus Peregrinibacteria bacterium CG11_big_fil_rev_8_21_14_0_20_46_8]|nr:MAG: hypothetical protein COV82_06475 [Candidatus Peregrinibacteria bacterium CG11_big_fil_rev_8_21_14_0_20_46_8]
MTKTLKILFLTNGIFMLAAGLFGPLYAVYVGQMQDGLLLVTFSWPIFLFSTTFFVYLFGKRPLRLSRTNNQSDQKRNILMVSYLIRACTWIAYIFVATPAQLLILQVFIGLAEALGAPTFDALVAENVSRENSLQAYSFWKMVSSVVTAVAASIGGGIVYLFGFNALFVVMAGLSIVSAYLMYYVRKEWALLGKEVSLMPQILQPEPVAISPSESTQQPAES